MAALAACVAVWLLGRGMVFEALLTTSWAVTEAVASPASKQRHTIYRVQDSNIERQSPIERGTIIACGSGKGLTLRTRPHDQDLSVTCTAEPRR